MKYFSLCFDKFCCLLLDAISFVLNHYCLLWINYWCDSAMLQFYVCCQVMQSLLVPCLLWLVCVHLPIDTHCDHLLSPLPPTRHTHLPMCQLFTVPSPQAHGRVQVWVLRLLGGSQASAQTTHAPAHCGLVKLWHSRGDLTSQVSLLRYVIFLAWLHVADCSAVLPAVTFVSLVKIAHQCPGWNGTWSTTYCSLPVTASTWQSPHSPAECHGICGGIKWVDGY